MKIKFKDRSELRGLIVILRVINLAKSTKGGDYDYAFSVMQIECGKYALKIAQRADAKQITLPAVVSLSLYLLYESVVPMLGSYEAMIYRNIVNDMDRLAQSVELSEKIINFV
jgi:hypothetical protein